MNNVSYSDICMKGVANPIFLTPDYSSDTGNDIPHYTNITFSDIHVLTGGNSPTVTLDGYSSSYINSVTLDNVIFESGGEGDGVVHQRHAGAGERELHAVRDRRDGHQQDLRLVDAEPLHQ